MTVRELRKILTVVENQNLTVRELRHILFDQTEQDAQITEAALTFLTR